MSEINFSALLNAYALEHDLHEREKIESRLWTDYGQERSVMILDMSGFSLLTQRYGIVHYLAMVKRIQHTVRPIIEAHAGSVVKFEADNCFSVFPTPLKAIEACLEIGRKLQASNKETDDEFDIHVSCGIDHGKILLLEGDDFFGNPVNRASKLGEDIANASELLVTEEAWQMACDELAEQGKSKETIPAKAMNLSISGIHMAAQSIKMYEK